MMQNMVLIQLKVMKTLKVSDKVKEMLDMNPDTKILLEEEN